MGGRVCRSTRRVEGRTLVIINMEERKQGGAGGAGGDKSFMQAKGRAHFKEGTGNLALYHRKM